MTLYLRVNFQSYKEETVTSYFLIEYEELCLTRASAVGAKFFLLNVEAH